MRIRTPIAIVNQANALLAENGAVILLSAQRPRNNPTIANAVMDKRKYQLMECVKTWPQKPSNEFDAMISSVVPMAA